MIEKAVILSAGDELMMGKLGDTSSAAIAERLFSAGIEVVAVIEVGDNRDQLLWALRQGRDLADLVIGTGGLGPAADDLAAEVVAEFLGCKLTQDEEVASLLMRQFAAGGMPWTANNLKQARFPEGSAIIPNPRGMAPGFRLSMGQDKTLVWLPGTPQETAAMLTETVMPWIALKRAGAPQVLTSTFKLYGLTETELDDLLTPVSLARDVKLLCRTDYPDLSLHLALKGGKQAAKRLEEIKSHIRQLVGSYIYAEGETTLEAVVGRLLLARRQTLALAESCTGGYISHRVTRVAGSSAYYYGGAVTYSNEAKLQHLGVNRETLERHGAVSRETALEMSRGIKDRSQATIGLSVTGIAGPAGATLEKPVGTVWMSIAREGRAEARLFHFTGERERIIVGASQAALNWLRLELLDLQ